MPTIVPLTYCDIAHCVIHMMAHNTPSRLPPLHWFCHPFHRSLAKINIYLQLAGCSPNRRISWSCVNFTNASYCSVGWINHNTLVIYEWILTMNYFLYNDKNWPASFVVKISSYSSRILSSRSFSSLSQISPTCLRENKGCSFLVGDVAPEDVPVKQRVNRKCIILNTATAWQLGQIHITINITTVSWLNAKQVWQHLSPIFNTGINSRWKHF